MDLWLKPIGWSSCYIYQMNRGWTLAVAVPRWQHHEHRCRCYYCYYCCQYCAKSLLPNVVYKCCLLSGCRWCMFPTDCPKDLLKPLPGDAGCNRNEAIAWFQFVYPRTQTDAWPLQYKPVSCQWNWGHIVETCYEILGTLLITGNDTHSWNVLGKILGKYLGKH